MTQASIFENCTPAPADPILGLAQNFQADESPHKIDLGIGAYRTNEGKPYVFDCVRQAETLIFQEKTNNKEYAPIDGYFELKSACQELIFGECSSRIASVQSISGTGGLRLIAACASRFLRKPAVYVSKPTWANHKKIFESEGLEVREYPYWDATRRGLNIAGMKTTLSSATPGSLVLLHSCAHNPTGVDPTESEWLEIFEVIKSSRLTPVVDNAYQGYASGNLQKDAFIQRHLYKEEFEFFVSQSFAKNFGLYGERMGMAHCVASSSELAIRVTSQLKNLIRPMYSSPPIHGAKIVLKILTNAMLRQMWERELNEISTRIASLRERLSAGLQEKRTPGTWTHITRQIGMFSYTGLSVAQSERMTKKWHIHMLTNGRISLPGLNETNINYAIEAIDDCVRNA